MEFPAPEFVTFNAVASLVALVFNWLTANMVPSTSLPPEAREILIAVPDVKLAVATVIASVVDTAEVNKNWSVPVVSPNDTFPRFSISPDTYNSPDAFAYVGVSAVESASTCNCEPVK